MCNHEWSYFSGACQKSNQSRGCGRVTTRTVDTAIGTLAKFRSTWYNNILLHFYTRRPLHKKLLTQNSLHKKPSTRGLFWPKSIYTRNILRQTTSTTECEYLFKFLHQRTLTPNTFIPGYFYNRICLHQEPFAPKNFYTRKPSTQGTLCTKERLHQKVFAEGQKKQREEKGKTLES